MALPRLFISTDMQMITGVNNIDGDKDDVQSLVHALMYQEKFDIVGIASSVSRWQPGKNDDSFIHHVIDEYAADRGDLAARADGFKSASELHANTYQGTKSLSDWSGVVGQTDASRAIVREAREARSAGEPLYVATWGGVGDVARALHDAPDIAGTIRLLSVAGALQEPNAHAFLKREFAGEGELWWIDEATTHFGVYATPNTKTPPGNAWAEANARGHGTLGQFFYENTLDVRGTSGTHDGMKMGDSHTTLYLIDGAGNNNDPTAPSWGGQYRAAGDKYWVDVQGQGFNFAGSDGARTIYEDRAAWTGDFAARLDWLQSPAPAAPPARPSAATPEAPPVTTPATATLGSGGDALVLKISQDAWQGSAQYIVSVDGRQIGGTQTARALQDSGQEDTVIVRGNWSAGPHEVTVTFLNDAWGGTASTDRNLHVEGITYNGVALQRGSAEMLRNGSVDFAFTDRGGSANSDMLFA